MDQTEHTVQDANQFWIGMFLGGLIGAMMIVLLGTEKGKKIAKKLQEEGLGWWEDLQEKTGEQLDLIQEKVVDEVEDLEDRSQELIRKGKELLEKGKSMQKQIVEQVDEMKNEAISESVVQADAALAHIEALQERGRQTTADLRKQLFKNIPKK